MKPTRPKTRRDHPTHACQSSAPRAESRRRHRLRLVPRLRALRAVHGGLSDVCRDWQRERQPARPHLSDARRDRRPAGADARGAAAPGAVPRLPGLRDGLPLGRAIRQADRAVSRGDGASRRRRAEEPATGFTAGFCSACFRIPSGCGAALAPARSAQRLGLIGLAESTGLVAVCCRRGCGNWSKCCRRCGEPSRRCRSSCRPIGKRRARVALFTGCVGDVMFRHTNWATARVLQQNGCDVVVPRQQVCCGAIHFHAGSERAGPRVGRRERGGVRLRRRRRDDRQRGRLRGDAQGLRPSLARRPAGGPRASSPPRCKDVSEFLDRLGPRAAARARSRSTATYHDACHLGHAQKIREAPRRLLAQDSRPGAASICPRPSSAAARPARTT